MTNHDNAQLICKDQSGIFFTIFNEVIKGMRDYKILPGFVKDICGEIISERLVTVPLLIVIAEAIYKGFSDPQVKACLTKDTDFKNKSEDELFKTVLHNIDLALRDYVKAKIEAVYPQNNANIKFEGKDWQEIMGEVYNTYGMEM